VAYQAHKDYRHPSVVRFDKAIEVMGPRASKQKAITWEQALEEVTIEGSLVIPDLEAGSGESRRRKARR
jgi:hypothetical protein